MRAFVMILAVCPSLARAEEGRVQFYADPSLVDSGLIQHIRPRFSLKTGVGVDMVDQPDDADLLIWDQGHPVFAGLGQNWLLQLDDGHSGAVRFGVWLTSDIGQRTIFGFAPDGVPIFTAPAVEAVEVAPVIMSGDEAVGREIAFTNCGRCHVTETERRMAGIGSTPSFAVLRSLDNWDYRFAAFYALNPHPAFVQIEDVTEPFPPNRPAPIAPVELTLDDLEAVLSYVETLAPADLGEPLAVQ